jgi:hypothetical protein
MTKTQYAQPDLLGGVKSTPEKPSKAAKPAKPGVVAKTENLPAKVEPMPISMLAVIARAAADKNVDPDKMRALLDMQKEIVAEEARMAFTADFIELQADLPVINAKGRIEIEAKRAGGKKQNTPYATFNEINRVTKPILKAHGFAMWFEPDVGTDGKIIMRGHLDHFRGHGKTCAISLPLETSGSKNNVQGVGSSISYGKRYSAIALLNLVSEALEDKDDDAKTASGDDAAAAEDVATITPKQFAELKEAIEDCGVPMETVCSKYGVEKIGLLPAPLFKDVMSACANFKKNRTAAHD